MRLRSPTKLRPSAALAAALAFARRRWDEASLRTKTLGIVVATVAVLLALIYIPLRLFVVDSYRQLEDRQVLTDVARAANALDDDQAELARVAADYATRDATYAFVRDRSPSYVAETLNDTTFIGNHISLLVLADEQGRVVSARAFDLASGAEAPVPEPLRAQVPAALLPGDAVGRGGLLDLADTLVLLSSHAVLPSDQRGPSRGVLLVGRLLDRAAVLDLAATTRLQLTVHRLNAEYPAPDVVAARDALAALPSGVVRPLGARQIAGYRMLTDIEGRPVAVLRVQDSRPVYEQGQASVAYFTMALLFATFAGGGVALELLHRSVVARQTRLSGEVLAIGAGGDLSARVAVAGGDEIAHLGEAINTMLSSIEQAQAERREAYAQLSELTEQLRRSRDILRTLFDGLDDGMALLDGDGTVLAANQRFALLLGGSPEGLVGEHIAPPARGRRETPIQAAVRMALGDRLGHRERIAHEDRREGRRVLDMRAMPLVDDGGAVEQTVLHLTDVTDRLRLEAAALQSERLAAGARLAAAVAHELNTPLQSIQSCLDLVRIAAPEQRETYLTIAQEEIRRISAILRSLLAVHRQGDGAPAALDVNALVERLLLLTSGTLGDRGVYVERDLAPDTPQPIVRADQLTQVLLNLVMNAADALPEGGTIVLRTAAEQGGVRIEVCDSGAGVPEDLRARIFDPFFTTKPEGSGLGLAICRQIVGEHGGRLEVSDAPGGGARFTIVLPAAAEIVAAEDHEVTV